MPRSTLVECAFVIVALSLSASASSGRITDASSEDSDVIVIMRDQVSSAPPVRGHLGARAAALSASHSSVVGELQRAGAKRIHEFALVNAIATTVSKAEVASLAANPDVQSVQSDAPIRRPRPVNLDATVPRASGRGAPGPNVLCNTLEPEALQLTNTAFLDSSMPQAQSLRDGAGQPVTGKGVKVAVIFFDGLDPTIRPFVRPDGSSVFFDYQDFSGDPAGAPIGGEEAYLDASSVAAQDMPDGKVLNVDISLFSGPVYPLPSPCNIRIRGMAPGASLVGLKIASAYGYATNSNLVQAIEYAVDHADVDVISETFGGNFEPDTGNNVMALANDAAVAAGVTVVTGSGDSGPGSTMTAPATDPQVINVGASTSYRGNAQLAANGYPLASGGYASNNMSELSSGGFTQKNARTVDVVAPGELGWAVCGGDPTIFYNCVYPISGNPAPAELAGGTSESAPLTAGEAALVIQAYRSTHRGASPSPAVVKQIIMSSATDLGAPAELQGAGLINSLAAVNTALSISDGRSRPSGHGQGLVYSSTSFATIDLPGTPESRSWTVTNTGTNPVHVEPLLQTLGAAVAGENVTLQLDAAHAPTFPNLAGAPRPYLSRRIFVPPGTQHLDTAIAWQTPVGGTATVFIILVNPAGQMVASSLPQGVGSGYGHAGALKPASGYWTAYLATYPTDSALTYSGAVQFSWSAERFVSVGTVAPASFNLPPGASQTLSAHFRMPTQPGDAAAAIRFGQVAGINSAEIPITMRTLVPIDPSGGSFSSSLSGGNGRADSSPTHTFAFQVPYGERNLSLTMELSDDNYQLQGMLVDPNGMQLSLKTNVDDNGNAQNGMQLSRFNPQAGQWQFILIESYPSSGNQTSIPFTAQITFKSPSVTAPGLPNDAGTHLSASAAPLTVPIHITNTSPVTQSYFADARLLTLTTVTLPQIPYCPNLTLPGACVYYVVPTEVSDLQFVAQSTVPINMNALGLVGYSYGTFSPDLNAKNLSPTLAVANLREPEVPYGTWFETPSLIGPFGTSGAPNEPVNMSATAIMQSFDPAFTADSGDAWADATLLTNTYNPLILAPGQSGVINATMTPNPAQIGKTISGYLYIDTLSYETGTGDEIARIPYRYTIAN